MANMFRSFCARRLLRHLQYMFSIFENSSETGVGGHLGDTSRGRDGGGGVARAMRKALASPPASAYARLPDDVEDEELAGGGRGACGSRPTEERGLTEAGPIRHEENFGGEALRVWTSCGPQVRVVLVLTPHVSWLDSGGLFYWAKLAKATPQSNTLAPVRKCPWCRFEAVEQRTRVKICVFVLCCKTFEEKAGQKRSDNGTTSSASSRCAGGTEFLKFART